MLMVPLALLSILELPGATRSRGITCCEHVKESDSILVISPKPRLRKKGRMPCTTAHVICLITCRICGARYVGKTGPLLTPANYTHRRDNSISLTIQSLICPCRILSRLVTTGTRSTTAETCGLSDSAPFGHMA